LARISEQRKRTMQVTFKRPSLLEAFSVVSGVVPSRTPKEILKNIKLVVDDQQVTLIGTDQEIGIRYAMAADDIEVEGSGAALLDPKRVSQILRESTHETVRMEFETGRVH